MKKFLFPVCAVLAILGCGGDNVDELPCFSCNEPFYVPSSSSSYNWYSSSSSSSSSSSLYLPCGSVTYNSSTHFCSGNMTYPKCGGNEYNPTTEACCGNNKYTLSTYFCSGNTAYPKCSGNDYNPATEACCNNSKYFMSTHFCLGSTVTQLCGGQPFTSSQFCYNNSIENKCGGTVTFTPGTEACCGNSKYTLSTHYCSNGTIKTYGTISYGGQTYKTVAIGTQTWLAENLNYAVSGSKCGNGSSLSDGNTASCNTYGRLYNWSTAMNINTSNNSSLWNGSDIKHKGICPTDWHIPSDAEWNVLMTAVGGSSAAGAKLKATSGWHDCGPSGSGKSYLCEDSYGFSALPGGYGSSDGYFYDVGNFGFWWSSTENSSYGAYYRYLLYSLSGVGRDGDGKSGLLSVRCVQD